ncbi:hypothetical protein HDU80_007309 [Chytriomyces hyalinus]|nr:hypothetical protein HDU80_007309 [Chytriomyces hyalinus]
MFATPQPDDPKRTVFRLLNKNQYASLLSGNRTLSPPKSEATISPIQHILGGFNNIDTQFTSFSKDFAWVLYYAYQQRWCRVFETPEFPKTPSGDRAWKFYIRAEERLVPGHLPLPQFFCVLDLAIIHPFEKKYHHENKDEWDLWIDNPKVPEREQVYKDFKQLVQDVFVNNMERLEMRQEIDPIPEGFLFFETFDV